MLNPIARPPSNGSRLTLHPGALFRFNPKKDLLVGGAGPGLRRDPWRGIGNAALAKRRRVGIESSGKGSHDNLAVVFFPTHALSTIPADVLGLDRRQIQ